MSRENEDARRVAVEAALAELLARDTQYRKELKAHLETRLQNAEARRTMLIGIIRKVCHHYTGCWGSISQVKVGLITHKNILSGNPNPNLTMSSTLHKEG